MMARRRIIILGAGIFQVPLIRKARCMGLETVVVSPPGDYPGIPMADIFVEMDITDELGVLRLAQSRSISGIVTTGSDVGVPTIGRVVDALGVKGPTAWMADTVSSKLNFRSFQKSNGLPHPAFSVCHDEEHAVSFYNRMNGKVVFKPDDSSGSRGVTIVDVNQHQTHVKNAYRAAKEHCRNGRVCVEAFVPGKEVGGEAFFVDGEPRFFVTTCKHMKGVLVQGHSLPDMLSDTDRSKAQRAISAAADRLGYRNGPLNFDMILGETEAMILEMGLRNGGNGILDLIRVGHGADLLDWLLKYVLGESVPKQGIAFLREVSSYVFGADRSGRLKEVPTLNKIRSQVPEVFELILAKKKGDRVEPFLHNANLVGYALAYCGPSLYKDTLERIINSAKIEVLQ